MSWPRSVDWSPRISEGFWRNLGQTHTIGLPLALHSFPETKREGEEHCRQHRRKNWKSYRTLTRIGTMKSGSSVRSLQPCVRKPDNRILP
ncbi:protein of unknown function [Kyrpidia spormannii]|uniref:Uncharacterized protein n=1 Tax=Kyrpidia spormannii TaxID=2055160 RepID=A0A6F9EEA0_9BACL|nr:protein of unknown function [Kyrpidia spormannii]